MGGRQRGKLDSLDDGTWSILFRKYDFVPLDYVFSVPEGNLVDFIVAFRTWQRNCYFLKPQFHPKVLWILVRYGKIIYSIHNTYLSTIKWCYNSEIIFAHGPFIHLRKKYVCSGRDSSGRDHLSTWKRTSSSCVIIWNYENLIKTLEISFNTWN